MQWISLFKSQQNLAFFSPSAGLLVTSIAACLVSMVHLCWRFVSWRTGGYVHVLNLFHVFYVLQSGNAWFCNLWSPEFHVKEKMRNERNNKTKLMIYFQSINNNKPTAQTILRPMLYWLPCCPPPVAAKSVFSFPLELKISEKANDKLWSCCSPTEPLVATEAPSRHLNLLPL